MSLEVHLELGHLEFEQYVDVEKYTTKCYLSRNLLCDAGPMKIQEEQKEENDEAIDKEPEDLLSSEDEGVWLLAQRKYDLFQKQYQDLLDPNLEDEFEIMRRMGLPTMLINSYDDIEDDEHMMNESNVPHFSNSRHRPKKIQDQIVEDTGQKEDLLNENRTDGQAQSQPDMLPETPLECNELDDELEKDLPVVEQEQDLENLKHTENEVSSSLLEHTENEVSSSLLEYCTMRESSDDDESSIHSSCGFIDVSKLNIDWDEVKEGKAAGLPSQWETVSEDEKEEADLSANIGMDLYDALRVKAAAYANHEWQEYWSHYGPAYLAECWQEQHPDIPLKHVETVSGLGFLCEALEQKMQLESCPELEKSTVEGDQMMSPDNSKTQTRSKADEINVVFDGGLPKSAVKSQISASEEHTCTPEALHSQCTTSKSNVVSLTDEEVLYLWNEFYNSLYWYAFQLFQGSENEELAGEEFINEECLSEEDETEPARWVSQHCREPSHFDPTPKTRYHCRGLGFCIGDKVGYNPHPRQLHSVVLKLRKLHQCSQRLIQQDHNFGFVGRDGRLLFKREGEGKRTPRRKKKTKKKKAKNKVKEDEDELSQSEIIDDITGQTETSTIADQTETSTTDDVTGQIELHLLQPETDNIDDITSQTEPYVMQTETDITQHELEEELSQEEDGLLDTTDNQIIIADHTSTVEHLAGLCICITDYLPPPLQLSRNPHHGLAKYWSQRYRLFSRYDEDIRMDHEGWFSASPEKIALHIAERCQCDLIVDAFCGVGSNTIQFAYTCERVIAIDIDPVKLACARHNAEIYGVVDRVDFILGDYFDIMPQIKSADVVFLSPPWGGPGYLSAEIFDLETMSMNGVQIFQIAREVTPHVAYYLPRNIGIDQLVTMVSPGEPIELEQHFINRKLKTMTAYFGELVNY